MKLTGLYECYHVQRFKDDIIVTEIKYNKEEFHKEWKNIEIGLINFIEFFEKIYFSINFQDLFLHKKFELDKNTNEKIVPELGIIIKHNLYKNKDKINKKNIMLFIILTKFLVYRYFNKKYKNNRLKS